MATAPTTNSPAVPAFVANLSMKPLTVGQHQPDERDDQHQQDHEIRDLPQPGFGKRARRLE